MRDDRHDSEGREVLDQTPVEIPVGFEKPESLEQMVRRFIQGEMSRQAVSEGNESFEDANDFEVTEEEWDEVITDHELLDMREEFPDGETTPQKEPLGEDEKPVGGESRESESSVSRAAAGSVREGTPPKE